MEEGDLGKRLHAAVLNNFPYGVVLVVHKAANFIHVLKENRVFPLDESIRSIADSEFTIFPSIYLNTAIEVRDLIDKRGGFSQIYVNGQQFIN